MVLEKLFFTCFKCIVTATGSEVLPVNAHFALLAASCTEIALWKICFNICRKEGLLFENDVTVSRKVLCYWQ